MNIKQLQYFLAIAETKNITTASKKLHMAQPPLSRQISLLEEELEVMLLKRSNKGIELTEAGQLLYNKAKKVLKDIETMTEMVKETNLGIRGTVRIGTLYSCVPIYAQKIEYLSKHYPLIKFNIYHEDPQRLLRELEKGKLDVLFFRTPTCESGNFNTHIMEEDTFVMVTSKDLDPCPENDEISIPQLKNIPLCMLRNGKFWGYNELLINECKKYGFEPNIICECFDTSIAMLLVMQGIGLSYQPSKIVDSLQQSSLYGKHIKDFAINTFPMIIWNDDAYLSRCVRLFLSMFHVKTSQPFHE